MHARAHTHHVVSWQDPYVTLFATCFRSRLIYWIFYIFLSLRLQPSPNSFSSFLLPLHFVIRANYNMSRRDFVCKRLSVFCYFGQIILLLTLRYIFSIFVYEPQFKPVPVSPVWCLMFHNYKRSPSPTSLSLSDVFFRKIVSLFIKCFL